MGEVQPTDRRGPRFTLRTLFVTVTLAACWLGWNVNVVHQRTRMREELHAEWWGPKAFHKSEIVQRAPVVEPQLSWIRQRLGDRALYRVVIRPTRDDALRTARLFPEAGVYYYAGASMPWPFAEAWDFGIEPLPSTPSSAALQR